MFVRVCRFQNKISFIWKVLEGLEIQDGVQDGRRFMIQLLIKMNWKRLLNTYMYWLQYLIEVIHWYRASIKQITKVTKGQGQGHFMVKNGYEIYENLSIDISLSSLIQLLCNMLWLLTSLLYSHIYKLHFKQKQMPKIVLVTIVTKTTYAMWPFSWFVESHLAL